jgi:cytochrome c peroxidase
MRTKFFIVVFVFTTIASAFISCNNESDVSPTPVTLDPNAPDPPEFPNGQIDAPVFKLGRVLFYDSHLSVNASISCASCHKQTLAFSDNTAFSRGFENSLTGRNSQPIQNLGLNSMTSLNLFWDGRESILQTMVLKPIINHVEMGMGTEQDIVDRVGKYPYYEDLFIEAFGTSAVTSDRISQALSTFVGSISSANSRFDRWQNGEGQLTAIELSGKSLFFTKYNCNACHKVNMPGFYQVFEGGFINIGLDAEYADNGRYNVTNNPSDRGRFKVPDLRNVALTAPYMHDGRFTTLDQVLEHYSHGISNHPNLDSRLQDSQHNAMRMNISSQEKTAIIAFLNTMTDYSMISSKSFSDPFVH